MVPSSRGYIDMALLLTQALFDDFCLYCTIPVFLAFANKVMNGGRPSPRSRSNRLPGGGWRRGDDRRPIVAGDRVRQLPRCEPGTGGPASGVAAEVGHLELRARRREVEGAAAVDDYRNDGARDAVLSARVPGG